MQRPVIMILTVFAASLAGVSSVAAQSSPSPGAGAILRSETRTINRATQEQTRDRLQRTTTAAEGPKRTTVTTDGAAIRATPAADGAVIGRLPKGARITVAGMDQGWYRLELGGAAGFVAQDDVRVR